jgi:hypothetical protein
VIVKPRGADLGDPDFEPTDEQLAALSRAAFSTVSARNREAMARVRSEIAALRREVLARLPARPSRAGSSR